MSTLERVAVYAALAGCVSVMGQGLNFGRPISAADIAPWDISVGPDGVGLPSGRGTARDGESVYVSR
jgi:cytochrome c